MISKKTRRTSGGTAVVIGLSSEHLTRSERGKVVHRSRWGVIAMILALSACNGVLTGKPNFDTAALIPSAKVSAQIPTVCVPLLQQDPGAQENVITRNNCVYSYIALIDRAYYAYQNSAFGSINGGNATADIVTLGITSAATLTPGATAKSILAAIATGINGAKGKVDADILYNKSADIILTQMDADRADWKSRMINQLKTDPSYNLYTAASDLMSYYEAGTWTHAILSLQSKAGTQLTSCQQNVKDQQLNTGQSSSGCQPQSATQVQGGPANNQQSAASRPTAGGGAGGPPAPPPPAHPVAVPSSSPQPQSVKPPVQPQAIF